MSRHTASGVETQMSSDALAQLHRAGFSRRLFLKGSGALVVVFSLGKLSDQFGIAPDSALAQGGNTPQTLDSWIAIGADGRVTVYTGRADMGQGMSTAQIQLIAEELSVPVSRVRLVECDTAMTPDQGTSSGSQGHPVNFNHGDLALAGATAREALFRMASTRLGVPIDQLTAADGVIGVKTSPANANPASANRASSVSYGDLVGGKRFNMNLQPGAKRKPSGTWTVLGTSVPRVDLPDLVTGRYEFVNNVRVPGMLHGRVVRPPAVGATVINVDENSVSSLPGVVKVVVRKNLVGVVAEKPWQAINAAQQLKVTWTPGTGLPAQRDFYSYMRKHPGRADAYLVNSQDVTTKLGGAGTIIQAAYLHPYQMHGSMGSSCAVADVRGNTATIWSATQAVYPLRNTAAMVLGLPPESVRVIYVRGSGCYGLNGADGVSYDAAVMSQAVGKPVRVQFSRKDEMAWGENYGLPYVMDQQAAVDAGGNIIAWDYESWTAALGNRPGDNAPGNVAAGMLAGFQPAMVAPRTPAPQPTQWNNRGNAVPWYLVGRVGGKANGTGTVTSERVLIHTVPSPFFTGPLRSPARLQNSFAHECFMDEIAARVKADPVEYRLRHLSDPRLKDVVSAAAKTASWDARPSPKPGISRTGVATGRGIACVLYEGENGYVALVAEVEVNQETGKVTAKRLVVAQDVGPISSPDGVKNELEGGALQGLSRALVEEVTWDNEKVTSVDWRTYHSLYLGSDVPAVESVLINRPEEEAMGAGETAITIVAAAVGNAIFDATGARVREVPFTPERVKAALATAASNPPQTQ